MILGIPVVDGHELTNTLLDSLAQTVTGNNFEVCIIDNNSEVPYLEEDYYKKYPFAVAVMTLNENEGYYAPLLPLAQQYDEADYIGLIHNDFVIYEQGWNERMEHSFAVDPKLALIGMVGSNEIDSLGGRGGGTVCNFRGSPGYQDPSAGRKTNDLVPSACLDSVFMMFKREALPDLVTEVDSWDNLPLAHFYDRIWPVRLIEHGWHVATLGVECDHQGGMTTVANPQYATDCKRWFEVRGLPYDNPESDMYLVAEQRYLQEYREAKKFIPMIVQGDYRVEHLAN